MQYKRKGCHGYGCYYNFKMTANGVLVCLFFSSENFSSKSEEKFESCESD